MISIEGLPESIKPGTYSIRVTRVSRVDNDVRIFVQFADEERDQAVAEAYRRGRHAGADEAHSGMGR
jgi:hypothetical protein